MIADILSETSLPNNWVRTSIGEIATYIQRGKSPQYTTSSDLPVINQKCIRWHGIIKDYVKYIHPDQWSAWGEERYLRNGDILWNSTGTGTIGRACIYRSSYFPKVVVDSHVTIVRLNQKCVIPEYTFYFIASPFVQKKIEEMQSGSTNQVELGRGAINETSIPLPPLAEQHRIVDKIEELFSDLDDGIASLKKAQHQLKVYRQAVLKWAFEGKLTAQWREEQQRQGKLESAETLLEQIKAEREQRYQEALAQWQADVKAWEANGKVGKKPRKPKEARQFEPLDDSDLHDSIAFPKSWRWEKLGNIADIVGGVTKGRKLEGKETISLPYLSRVNASKLRVKLGSPRLGVKG